MTRTDVVISPEGFLQLFYLLSPAAEQWVEYNIGGERQFFAGALVVDHRFADDLARGMSRDGLRVGVIAKGWRDARGLVSPSQHNRAAH